MDENIIQKANYYLVELNLNELNSNELINVVLRAEEPLDWYFLMLNINQNGIDLSKFNKTNAGIQFVTLLHKLFSVDDRVEILVLKTIVEQYPEQKLNEINLEMLNEIVSYLNELPIDTTIPISFTDIYNENLNMDLYEIANYLNMYDTMVEHHEIKLSKLNPANTEYTNILNLDGNMFSIISKMFEYEGDQSLVYLPKYDYQYSKLLELIIINTIIKLCCIEFVNFDINNINKLDLDPNTLQYQVYTLMELIRQNSPYQQQILNIMLKISVKLNITQPAIELSKYKRLYWEAIKLVESDISNFDIGIYNLFKEGQYNLPQIDISWLLYKSLSPSNKLCISITRDQIQSYIYYYNNLTPNLYYDDKKLLCWDQFKIFLRVFKHRGLYTIRVNNRNYITLKRNPLALQKMHHDIDDDVVQLYNNLISKLNFSYPFDFITTMIRMVNFSMEEIESLFISKIYKRGRYTEEWFQDYFVLAVLHNHNFNMYNFNTQQMYKFIQLMNFSTFEMIPMLSLLYFQVEDESLNSTTLTSSTSSSTMDISNQFKIGTLISSLPDIINTIKETSSDEFELFYNSKNYNVPEIEIILYIQKYSTTFTPLDIVIIALLIQNNPMMSCIEQKYLSLIINYNLHRIEYLNTSKTGSTTAINSTSNENSKFNDIEIYRQNLIPVNANINTYYSNLIYNKIDIDNDIEYLAKILPKIKDIQFYKNLITLF